MSEIKKRGENVWSWNVDEVTLSEQIKDYETLKITKSFRGICVIFFLTLNLITIIASIFLSSISSLVNPTEAIIELLMYAPFLFFAYRGYRWAFLVLIMFWSVDKFYTFWLGITQHIGSPITSIIFYALGITLIVKALKVENARRKTEHLNNIAPNPAPSLKEHE
jgi:hypothetical protein